MEKFSINSPQIKGKFYTEQDVHNIYNLMCKIKDVIEFAKGRPNHEKTNQFLEDGIVKCMEVFEILKTDNQFIINDNKI